ncbi:MAG: heavy-metal-associated domain-containing protein [Bacteroidales bacterium]|nr:heavy-metal-associated domain-containing protein [Bacteroidales bacterium]
MKKIAVMAILAAAMLAGAQTASAENMNNTEIQLFKKGKTETKTVTFKTTIHCENCAKKVKENISFEKGVKGLEVSVDDKMVKVTYDPSKITVEKLKAALKKLGYDAEVIA